MKYGVRSLSSLKATKLLEDMAAIANSRNAEIKMQNDTQKVNSLSNMVSSKIGSGYAIKEPMYDEQGNRFSFKTDIDGKEYEISYIYGGKSPMIQSTDNSPVSMPSNIDLFTSFQTDFNSFVATQKSQNNFSKMKQ